MLHATFTLGSEVRLGSERYVLAELDKHGLEGPSFTLVGVEDQNNRVTRSINSLLAQYGHGNLRLVPSEANAKRLLLKVEETRRLMVGSMSGKRRYRNKSKNKREQIADDDAAQAKRIARTQLKIDILRFVSDHRVPMRFDKQFAADIQEFRQTSEEYSVENLAKLPSLSSVKRWKSAKRRHLGDNSKLMDRTDLRGGTAYRVDPQTEEFMRLMIDEHYLAPMCLSIPEVHKMIEGVLLKKNLDLPPKHQWTIPSQSTVERRIRDRDAYDVHAARHGKAAADYYFRSSTRGYSNQIPFMSELQVDHTSLDFLVVCKYTRQVLGRPRVSLAVEPRTGMVHGVTIGFDGMSSIVVLECLRQAILPKDHDALKAMGVADRWDAYGKPLRLNLDNGGDFHSNALIEGCQNLDIDMKWSGKRKPWFKASVERAIREFVEKGTGYLPGAVLKPHIFKLLGLDKDPKNDPSKWAVLDLDQLNAVLHKWLIDQYLQAPNSGKGKISRAQLWLQLARPEDLQLPANRQEFELLCTVPDYRTITHTGIAICDLKTFNSPMLQEMRMQHGHKGVRVKIRYSPRKLDKIWFQDCNGDAWYEVLNSDRETADLSEHQVKVIHANQAMAAEEGRKITFAESRVETSKYALALFAGRTQAMRRAGQLLLNPEAQIPKQSRSAAKEFGTSKSEAAPNTLVPSNVVDFSQAAKTPDAASVPAQSSPAPATNGSGQMTPIFIPSFKRA